MLEADNYCIKCNWKSKGLVPAVVGEMIILEGDLADEIRKHHIDSDIEGKILRHRDFIALLEDGKVGSIMGSSYGGLYMGYGRTNIDEIDRDQILNDPNIRDVIIRTKLKFGK